MKKFLLLLLLFIPLNANALEKPIYFPYTDYSEFGELKIPSSDLIDVVSERRYMWYNEVVKGEYFLEGEGLYSLIDYDKNKLTDFTDWTKIKPLENINRLIEEKTVYEYQDLKKVNKIIINDISDVSKLYISEIEIFSKGEKLNYGSYCHKCNLNMGGINNGITNEVNSFIESEGFIELQLENFYDINDLEINIYLYDDTNSKKSFTLFLGVEGTNYVESSSVSYFTSSSVNDIKKIEFSKSSFSLFNPVYEELKLSEVEVKESLTKRVRKYNLYRSQDTLIYYYDVIKNYSSTYSKDKLPNYPNKDTTKYKDYYKSRSRDKVIIEDNIVLNSRDNDLKKYVVFTTIKDYKYNEYINFDRNGKYKVEYIFNENVVPVDVIVDIKEDTPKKEVKKSSLPLFLIIIFSLILLVIGFVRQNKKSEK